MTGAVQESRRMARRTEVSQRRWHDLRDVRHPLQPDVRLQAVLLRPTGVYVVTDAPSPAVSRVLDQPVAAAASVTELVAAVVPARYRAHVRPVMCVSDEGEPVAELVDGVLVITPSTLEHVLRSSPVVFSTSELNEMGLRLEARLEPFPVPEAVRQDHRLRRWLLLGAAAAASGLGAAALIDQAGAITLPW